MFAAGEWFSLFDEIAKRLKHRFFLAPRPFLLTLDDILQSLLFQNPNPFPVRSVVNRSEER